MISREFTIGTPDFIMVANCRLKIAISLGVIALPLPPNNGLGLAFTTLGVMPWRRSSARTMLAVLAVCSPFMVTPRLSLPSQTNSVNGSLVRSAFLVAVLVADTVAIPGSYLL